MISKVPDSSAIYAIPREIAILLAQPGVLTELISTGFAESLMSMIWRPMFPAT